MKNKGLYLGIFVSILLISFVSAAASFDFSTQISNFIEGVAKTAEPILKYTIGTPEGDSSIFVVKVLLFILMLSIFYVAVGQVPMIGSSNGLRWIVSIIIGILGARFISSEALVNAIWLPSGVTAITLVCILPFLIFFFFIESFTGHRVVRRVGWALYGVIFASLAVVRWDSLQDWQGWNLGWIYVATAVLAFLSFVFDGTIQKYFAKAGAQKAVAQHIRDAIQDRRRDLVKAASDYKTNIYGPVGTPAAKKAYDADVKRLEKEIEDLAKRI